MLLSAHKPFAEPSAPDLDRRLPARNSDIWHSSMSSSGTNPRPQPPGLYTNKSASTSTKPIAPYPREQPLDAASFAFHSSPPIQHQRPPLAAPRAMPPYTHLNSAQSTDPVAVSAGRSPSPSKRTFNFPIGDPSERWNSIGQATQLPLPTGSGRKQSIHANIGSVSAAEPFLGYNELFSPNGVHMLSTSDMSKGAHSASLSTSDPMNAAFASNSGHDPRGFSLSSNQEQDAFASRFGGSGAFPPPQDEFAFSSTSSSNPHMDDFGGRQSFAGPSMSSAVGNMSPRSLMHYQQMQAQQTMPPHTGQQGGQGGTITSAGPSGPLGNVEEITTVFIVGFPDDMSEREFANMFLFAKGFEASTLKVPVGFNQPGPGGRPDNGPLSAGPGGPYQAVNMPGSGLYDAPNNGGGSWEDQMALARAGASDAFSSLANMGSVGGANASAANAAAGGKIKQIIGFAKFRTRIEALEARDALNGRKIDAEKGCVLKTEMAKKNLHTKQRLAPSGHEGAGPFPPPPAVGPNGPLSPMSHPAHLPSFGTAGPYEPRSGPPPGVSGVPMPFGGFPPGKGPSAFDSFPGQPKAGTGGSGTPADLISPQEMFTGSADFFSQGVPPSVRTSGSEHLNRNLAHHMPTGSDKWGPSTGPFDYYAPDAGSGPIAGHGRQSISGATPVPATQGRPDWSAVGSPPGLHNVNAARPTFHTQGSRGTSSDFAPGRGPAIAASKPESMGTAATSGPSSSSDSQQPQSETPTSLASRVGQLAVGSPTSEEASGGSTQVSAGRPGNSNRASSPDLPSPTGRNVVGDNHPPVNTLFVGNLPSNASSAALSQLEDQMRSLFGSRRGFRQLSFRLKSNGPMCFVEFDDVHTAGKAMSELNGNTLNGAIKNGGIRLSFSKNPLFRMNSGGGGGGGAPSGGKDT